MIARQTVRRAAPGLTLPMVYTVAATTAPMPAAISAYSIAVAPRWSAAARLPSVARYIRTLAVRCKPVGGDVFDTGRSISGFRHRHHSSVVRCEISGTSAGGIG
jgi:hypothetical protein